LFVVATFGRHQRAAVIDGWQQPSVVRAWSTSPDAAHRRT